MVVSNVLIESLSAGCSLKGSRFCRSSARPIGRDIATGTMAKPKRIDLLNPIWRAQSCEELLFPCFSGIGISTVSVLYTIFPEFAN
jgi:hypothetical protein